MILITLPNVTGDCEIPNFSGYWTAQSFSFSASREITESAKAGTRDAHIGMAERQEVSISKSMDKASVPLMKWAIAGTQIPGEVLIRFVETGTDASGNALHINFMNVKLDRTFVKSWTLNGSEDDRPTEDVTLYFQYFAIAYAPFKGEIQGRRNGVLISNEQGEAVAYAMWKTALRKLAEGIATLAAAFYPKRVIVRMSDFKSNEYANLVGGTYYEPHEENPMLGFRGASRYIAQTFRDCFELECRAMRKVRNDMGLTNVEIMVPFVRTVGEAKQVIDLLAQNGLKRGENGLRIIMMCEIPSNAILADEFLQYFDGFSIGSNDLTQMTLALDRDSGIIAEGFDERDPAVKHMLHLAIAACRKAGKYVGICGQGPSDHPDLAKWLVEEGIESLSLNPDTVVETWLFLAREVKIAAH